MRGHVHPGTTQKLTDRHDEFHQDDSLRDADLVHPQAYADWNKANPDDKMDLGHGFGSQNRRRSPLEQHDIDVMTNVWPERPGMNRKTKQLAEGHIVELGNDPKTRKLIVTNGPGFDLGKSVQWMPSGPAIPHFSWVHVLCETSTNIKMWAFIFPNVDDCELQQVSTNELSDRLGFEVCDNMNSGRGITAKKSKLKPWWKP